MTAPDKNIYHNTTLGFEIRKPNEWIFLPSEWAIGFREQNLSEKEKVRQILKMANKPFVAFYLPHDSHEYVYPTVQAICRVVSGTLKRKAFLELQVENLKKVFRDFELLESSPDAIIAGKVGTKLITTYSLENEEGTLFDVLAQNYVVLRGNLAFNIGLSGPVDGPLACESEFEEIISSLKIS